MKNLILLPILLVTISCQQAVDTEEVKKEIVETESAFEQMVADSGLAAAFYQFAAEDAIIKRGNDSLIKGRDDIRNYYSGADNNITLSWKPDHIGVSEDGTLGYTHGQYIYTRLDTSGERQEYTGVFHTVWRKEADGWKYVWD